MDQEEVRIKLGVDNSQVAPALNDFKDKVGNAAKETHKSFLHASNGAKEFHKAIHEVAQESPLLGLALKAALSPVGAIFTAATLAAAGFEKMIESVTVSLDKMRDSNAEAFGNPHDSARSVAARIRSAKSDHRKFEASLIAPEPGEIISEGLEKIAAFFRKPEEKPTGQTPAERKLLLGSEKILKKRQEALDRELKGLESQITDPQFLFRLEEGKASEKKLQSKVDALKLQEPTLREQAQEDAGAGLKGRPTNLRQVMTAIKFGLGMLPGGESPFEKLKELDSKKEALRKIVDENEKLDAIDKKNNDTLKEKRAQLAAVLNEIKKIHSQLALMPTTPGAATPTDIDPITGGVPYKPITDRGGVAYRPIRGAPDDWMEKFNRDWDSAGQQKTDQVAALVATILKSLEADGIPVSFNVKE